MVAVQRQVGVQLQTRIVALLVYYSLGGQFLLCVGGYIATSNWGRGTRVPHRTSLGGHVFFVWSSALNSRFEVEATNKVMRVLKVPCATFLPLGVVN